MPSAMANVSSFPCFKPFVFASNLNKYYYYYYYYYIMDALNHLDKYVYACSNKTPKLIGITHFQIKIAF